MCTRFTLHNLDALRALLENLEVAMPESLRPLYNIPLTTRLPAVVRRRGVTALEPLSFGMLLPPRSPGEKPMQLANARAETLLQRPAFRDAVRHRRCLVPADGFYEWEHAGRARLPHYFHRKDGAAFWFAGLWREGSEVTPPAFVLVTTTPNSLVAPLHDRMPVVLEPGGAREWLGDEPLPPARLAALGAPWAPDGWTEHPVDPRMNSARHEGPDCIAPWHAPAEQRKLFD